METKKQSVMNVPNCLSLARMVMAFFFVASVLYIKEGIWSAIVPALWFGLASLTDMLDGMIARKYNLISDFGKFLDPLADKFLVFSALACILASERYDAIAPVFVWVAVVLMLRELGVTSMRLVVASKNVVVAASFFGKAKTCTQIAGILVILLEPLMGAFGDTHILSYILMGGMIVTTIGSGIDYLSTYMPYLTGKAE